MAQLRRVVVTGATGNIGLRTVEALVADPAVGEVVGLARRRPDVGPTGVRWVSVDLTPRPVDAPAPDPLDDVLAGADAVVHLAWLIQPARHVDRLWEVNVGGTARLLAAAARNGVGVVVHASSVGAYSPAPRGSIVDESWPTHGVASSSYSLAKAYTERLLDAHEARYPDVRVVRLRPSLVVQRRSAAHVRRLFLGALVPDRLLAAADRVPVVPDVPGLAAQLVHAEDVAAAAVVAVTRDVRGAFNLAADPPLDLPTVAEQLGARTIRLPATVARTAVRAAFTGRIVPIDVGWFDLALASPLLATARARDELGWAPRWDGHEALADVLAGLGEGAGDRTPPLDPDAERSRLVELATARQGDGEVV